MTENKKLSQVKRLLHHKKFIIISIPVLLIVFFVLTWLAGLNEPTVNFNDEQYPLTLIETKVLTPPTPVQQRFGIPLKAMRVVEDRIQPSQALSNILTKYNVPAGLIGNMAQQARSQGIFDVRKIRVNSKYTLLCSQEEESGTESSELTARYFIYEPSPLDYVVFDFADSVSYAGRHKIDTVQQSFAGVIDYSVYQTLSDGNVPTDLVYKLADVYAWQVDPFKVQKGDRFKVIYEELQVNGERIGLGKILSAYFEHEGMGYYGFYFNQNSDVDYFDEFGNSLRKAFLKTPLRYSRISSRFSKQRFHPVLKVVRPHYGTDYAAAYGTPIHAVGDGVIVFAGYTRGSGHMVKIKHNGIYSTGYLHMSKYGENIRVGTRIKQGDVIGYVGSTGLATGPHLCFRFWKNGQPSDPLSVEIPPSTPIDAENKDTFQEVAQQWKDQLDKMEYVIPENKNAIYASMEEESQQNQPH